MKTLYLDCGMGAAGDMLFGALLELHPDPADFLRRFNGLGIPRVAAEAKKEERCGITGTHMEILIDGVSEHEHHGHHHEHSKEAAEHGDHHIHSGDTPEHHALLIELSRIEQYVEMVLQYIRIGSGTNDLVIREYDLDTLICESVRKFAPQFFEKKLQLIYEKTDATIVSDRKWFICILDQLLSNAVKYTSVGSVTISVKDSVLSVADTGIGIAPEDLPRIFEKGYTGTNGRIENRSSGLGLYLAKKAADLLSIRISAESVIGKGSTFILDLTQERVR